MELKYRRWIFGGLLALTVSLGVLAVIWMGIGFQSGATAQVFGFNLPQWVLPAVIVYLALRNLTRLWSLRENLWEGRGDYDLSGTLLGRLFKANPSQTPSGPNRAQRRQAKRK